MLDGMSESVPEGGEACKKSCTVRSWLGWSLAEQGLGVG